MPVVDIPVQDGVNVSSPEAVCSNYAIGLHRRFKGTTLAKRKAKDSSQCCSICTRWKRCVGWVFRKKTKKCILRSHITGVMKETGATSAVDLDDAKDACPSTHRYRADPTSNAALGAHTCWRSWNAAARGSARTCKDWCVLPHHVGDAKLQSFLKRCPTSVCGLPTAKECPVKFPFLAGKPGYYKQLTDKACWTSKSLAKRGMARVMTTAFCPSTRMNQHSARSGRVVSGKTFARLSLSPHAILMLMRSARTVVFMESMKILAWTRDVVGNSLWPIQLSSHPRQGQSASIRQCHRPMPTWTRSSCNVMSEIQCA